MDPFQFLVEWFIICLLFVQVDFSMLFSTLSCRKIIQLFSSMLMERRIILCAHSLRWGKGWCVCVCVFKEGREENKGREREEMKE